MQTSKIETGIATIEKQYGGFLIANQDDYSAATKAVQAIKAERKKIVGFFAESKANAHATWKSIVAQEKSFTSQLDAVESKIKKLMSSFVMEQNRIRQAEQNRLRLEAEAKAKKEQERLLAEAKEAEESGDTEKAEEVLLKAFETEAIVSEEPDIQLPSVEGASSRKTWIIEDIDKEKFIEEAIKNPSLMQYINIDEAALKRAIISSKGELTIPGVVVKEDVIIAIRK